MYKSKIHINNDESLITKLRYTYENDQYDALVSYSQSKIKLRAFTIDGSGDIIDEISKQSLSLNDYFKSEDYSIMVNSLLKNKIFDSLISENIISFSLIDDYNPVNSLQVLGDISKDYRASKTQNNLIHLIDIHNLTEYLGTLDEVLLYLKVETSLDDIGLQGLSDEDLEKFKRIESDSQIKSEDRVERAAEQYEKLPKVEINWPNGVNLADIIKVLSFKKAILLQGPPGTGKTKMAEAIGYTFLNGEDAENSKYDIHHFREVQFSSEYSYSDFIDGLRPNKDTGNWELKPGVFRQLCEDAEKLPNDKFILFIDEINRADTESVIGEMLNLMEKRDRQITTKNGTALKIPSNLYIIATMNTIDRGAGALDMATISRFAEIDIKAADVTGLDILKAKKLKNYEDELLSSLNSLIEIIKEINVNIADDTTVELNPAGLQLGLRSLYTGYSNKDELILAVKYDLIPELNSRASKLSEETVKNGVNKLLNWIAKQ